MTEIKNEKFLKESGTIPKKQMILFGVIGVIAVIVVILISGVLKPPPPPPLEPEKPKLVYEISLEDAIRFKLQEVKDRGDVLKMEECKKDVKGDVTTTERFIEVDVLVDNIGKDNLKAGSWDIVAIYDSEGSKFYSLPVFNYWVSEDSKCSDVLKPRFTPTLCSKIYEVAKVSSGLKLEVYFKESKKQAFIDLGI